MSGGSVGFSESHRNVLAALADVLVPASEKMPSASEAGVSEKWLDRVLEARPDLWKDLARVLDGAQGQDPETEARRLHADDPEGFATLSTVVVGGYYLSPKVRKRIGYPGQKRNPPYPDEADYYLDEGKLLDPVREMEPIYRSTPLQREGE